MKYIGIDYGSKTIGVAISDAGGSIAFPREHILTSGNAVQKVLELVKAEQVGMVVMGDTLAGNGAENAITPEATQFATALAAAGVEVKLVREAWSSAEAARFAPKGKTHDDSAAAAIILQRFLDGSRK